MPNGNPGLIWLATALLLLRFSAAFAICPTIITDCPSPTYNTPNIGGTAIFGGGILAKNGLAGPLMLNVNTGSNDIEPLTDIVLPGGTWGAGALTNGLAPIFQNATFAGTTTGAAAAFGMFLQQSDNSSNSNAGFGVFENLTINGSSASGGRTAGFFQLTINATSAITAGPQYVGLIDKCNLDATVGTAGNYAVCFSENAVAHAAAGVSSNGIVGAEFDTWIETGAVVAARVGVQIVDIQGSTYGVQATVDDVAFSMNNQYGPSSTLGYKIGIEFGRYGGFFPVATNGTLIFGTGNVGGGFTVADGVDWHLGTFTGNSWNDGHITMSGAGVLAASQSTLSYTKTTNEATSAAGYFIPFASTSGIAPSSSISGTNIPANDSVLAVSGGTATVSTTIGFTIAHNAIYFPVNNAAGILPNMLATDTTTPANLSATATVAGTLSPTQLTPVVLTSPTASNGSTTITVASGGAACVPGMMVFDATTPASTFNGYAYLVSSATATTITVSLALTGAIVNTDTVTCWPAIVAGIGSVPQAGGLTSGDTVVFSPAIALAAPTTGVIANGATITFTNPVSSLSASGSTIPSGLDLGGGGAITWNGQTVFKTTNGTTYQNDPGGDLLIGLNAGAALGVGDSLTTAIGYLALNKLVTENSESTAVGYWAGANVRYGGYLNLFGVGALTSCQFNCSYVTAFGTDVFRNSLRLVSGVAFGPTTGLNWNGTGLTAVGSGLFQGPSNGTFTGNWLVGMGYGTGTELTATTASDLDFFGNFIGSGITTAGDDVCIGDWACNAITSDSWNTAVGYQALTALTGQGNTGHTALGMYALQHQTGGQFSTAIGFAAASNYTTGSYNTVIGELVGSTVCTTAHHTLLIGVEANTTCGSAGESYAIHIGAGAADIIAVTGTNTPSTSATVIAGTLNVAGVYEANGTSGVSCAANTVVLTTFAVTNGIVTHC